MDQNPAETKQILQTDVSAVDAWLKNLWDRAKKAAEIIIRLREERAELQARVTSMEAELAQLKQQLAQQAEAMRSAPAEKGDHSFLSNGERDLLTTKVKELLTKLDGYV